MIDPPKTIEEARKYRYDSSSSWGAAHRYCKNYCAYEVWPQEGWHPYQCSRKNGHGPNGLYCKQHAKMVEV